MRKIVTDANCGQTLDWVRQRHVGQLDSQFEVHVSYDMAYVFGDKQATSHICTFKLL